METNTVVLKVDRYNELYDLEKAIKEGKRLTIKTHCGFSWYETTTYYTDDEITKELKERCEELEKENRELKGKLEKAERNMPKLEKPLTIEEIKQMNYWQFRKWKKGKFLSA